MTLSVVVPGKGPLLLHSARDPREEARRLTSKYEDATTENVVFLGLGLGYHILEYLQRPHNRDFALVIEPSLERFRCCLEQVDWSEVIEQHNVRFAVDLAPLDVFKMLRADESTLVRNGLKAFKHPPSMALNPAYYQDVIKRLQDAIYYAMVNSNSREKSWRRYADNLARNLPTAMHLPGVGRLFGAFEGVPAIIVSAGPSLNKNVRELIHAKGRAVIIAVDTALHVLLNHNIKPDLVVSIDFSENNLRCFDGIDTSQLRLVVDAEVHPPVLNQFQGPRFYADITNKSASMWLSRAIGGRGGVEKGLSVAHTAFTLAMEMGCRPIALIGQDLAYTGNVSHAKGAAVSRIETSGPGVGNVIAVPDIFGRPVNSHASMVVFLRHFEELIHTHATRLPDGCIDATEGGAHIGGTRLMTLKAFITRWCTRTVDIDARIDAAAVVDQPVDPNHVLDEVETMRRELKALVRDTHTCRTALRALLNELGKTQADRARVIRFQKRYAEGAAALESHHTALELIADGLTRAMNLMRDRRVTSGGANSLTLIKQFLTIVNDIQDAAEFWLRLLRETQTIVQTEVTAPALTG